ncbi:hypothetical protein HMPREF9064_1426 [Aggregatibacter segnis ATCC 33393]|uniref:Uncharacterized protein n=1 Tax=Aggregatibacter segnis ATCC 33393 TaxID=888057 RepID=E6KZ84_9PAST|nr:hypothetical protein HMPREF9064_1426 [Aggregatibacter segnis ATCC 33393]
MLEVRLVLQPFFATFDTFGYGKRHTFQCNLCYIVPHFLCIY